MFYGNHDNQIIIMMMMMIMMMNYDNQIMSIIINHQDKIADQNNDKLFISLSAIHIY